MPTFAKKSKLLHKSGFINIIGRPNVGKSTLMNTLVGERMSIITHKPQTTRHRIIGIMNDENYQLIFSDTPGVVRDPAYKMHEAMNRFVKTTFDDADVMLFLTEHGEKYEEDDPLIHSLQKLESPLFLVINKTDTASPEEIVAMIQLWNNRINFAETIPISALNKTNTDTLLKLILQYTPEGPAYYPKDQLTDRPERFFVSEIIREKILLQFNQEIPYSCEVIVEDFKESPEIIRIRAIIYVSRKTQKSIIIGKGGSAIKRLGTEARKAMEAWLQNKVFLDLHVKVRDNWRDDEQQLKHFGYQ